MGLNLSNRQIAQELDLDEDDVQAMTVQSTRGLSIVNQKSSYQEMLNVMKFMSAQDTRAIQRLSEKGRQGRRNRLKGSGSGDPEKKSRQYLG